MVANSNDASLSTIRRTGMSSWQVLRTSLAQLSAGTDTPNGIVAASGGRLLVTLGGDNAVAVVSPNEDSDEPWEVTGLIPTGWYPNAVAVSPDGKTLHTVTLRGYGRSAPGAVVTTGFDPMTAAPFGAYLTVGTLESLAVPTGPALRAFTKQVRATLTQVGMPVRWNNPVFLGPDGPIKHVIYVLRENKTYDSYLGDLHPGPGQAFTLFGQQVTPNLHALETQFAESQAFYHEGHASNVGHMWTDTGGVSDVFERAIASGQSVNVSHLHAEWSDPANYLQTGLFTAQAARAGLSVRTYNEEIGQQSGSSTFSGVSPDVLAVTRPGGSRCAT